MMMIMMKSTCMTGLLKLEKDSPQHLHLK